MTKTTSPSILHVSTHADFGGAARASVRIAQCQYQHGLDSELLCMTSVATSAVVKKFEPVSITDKLHTVQNFLRRSRAPSYKDSPLLIGEDSEISHYVPGLLSHINDSSKQIINLHWINGLLSIKEIGSINKPVVWTLHDMWAFCGCEHYTTESRWRDGYSESNRLEHEFSSDINRRAWDQKRMHWSSPMHIVSPSHWLAHCVRQSALMRDWPVSVIPYPIDTEFWTPLPQSLARKLLGLPERVPLVLFGAFGAGRDPRKGFDLLRDALENLRADIPDLELAVFGQADAHTLTDLGLRTHFSGHLDDDTRLRAMYSAADVFVLPSRQDNLPNTGIEALACGTPVVAFDTGGMPDIVIHKKTGYLSKPFDTDDLAKGISWVLENSKTEELRERSRTFAVQQFSCSSVAAKYASIYQALRKRSVNPSS
jgi:glycosyltransferase involved in cell wall biosynthesis